jgi:hypothetical protein
VGFPRGRREYILVGSRAASAPRDATRQINLLRWTLRRAMSIEHRDEKPSSDWPERSTVASWRQRPQAETGQEQSYALVANSGRSCAA